MADEGWSPADVDLVTPNTARIYDYLLGGKDNYAADREVAEQLLAVIPEARMAARENQAFIGRAVRFLAREGIRQFVDIGCKLPAKGNVHEVAAEVAPDATVLFADGDPVVLAHARALLARTERAAVVQCDPKHPEAITSDPQVRALIDFGRPVGIVLDRVLHFVDGTAEAAAAVAHLYETLAPGSHVVFTHITRDPQPESSGEVGELFKPTTGHFWGRRRTEIEEIVSSFDLVEPGLTYTPLWRPDRPGERVAHPERTFTLAGVGRRD
jgi:hypothetical protein